MRGLSRLSVHGASIGATLGRTEPSSRLKEKGWLLEHRDGLVLGSLATYWLGELAATIDDRDALAKRARFTSWLESLVRGIHGHTREHNHPSTTTDEARRALI
ncbi:hypothetical protein GCM10010344_00400 [Streptomyces bluensis]|nr:hypothetical protein GCM10010344_00400 [Streptomyces bluensis]